MHAGHANADNHTKLILKQR